MSTVATSMFAILGMHIDAACLDLLMRPMLVDIDVTEPSIELGGLVLNGAVSLQVVTVNIDVLLRVEADRREEVPPPERFAGRNEQRIRPPYSLKRKSFEDEGVRRTLWKLGAVVSGILGSKSQGASR